MQANTFRSNGLSHEEQFYLKNEETEDEINENPDKIKKLIQKSPVPPKTASTDRKNHPGLLRGRIIKNCHIVIDCINKKTQCPSHLIYIDKKLTYLKEKKYQEYQSFLGFLVFYKENETVGGKIKNSKTWEGLKRFFACPGGHIFKDIFVLSLLEAGQEDMNDWAKTYGGSKEGKDYILSGGLRADAYKFIFGEGSNRGNKSKTKK
jgi:hypothetical protein